MSELDEIKRRAGIVNEAVDYNSWVELPMDQALQQLSNWNRSNMQVDAGRGYIELSIDRQPMFIIEALGGNDAHALMNPEFVER